MIGVIEGGVVSLVFIEFFVFYRVFISDVADKF